MEEALADHSPQERPPSVGPDGALKIASECWRSEAGYSAHALTINVAALLIKLTRTVRPEAAGELIST